MKRLSFMLFSCFAVLPCLPSITTAQVVLDDVVIFGSSSGQGLMLVNSYGPADMGVFFIGFEYRAPDEFEVVVGGIAQSFAFFEADFGDLIAEDFVSTYPLVYSNPPDIIPSFLGSLNFESGESRYFGYWDDRSEPYGPDPSDNYGWVRLTRVGNVLTADESVTALGKGIVVGSFTAVPEPSATMLFMGLFSGGILRRNRSK